MLIPEPHRPITPEHEDFLYTDFEDTDDNTKEISHIRFQYVKQAADLALAIFKLTVQMKKRLGWVAAWYAGQPDPEGGPSKKYGVERGKLMATSDADYDRMEWDKAHLIHQRSQVVGYIACLDNKSGFLPVNQGRLNRELDLNDADYD